MGIVDDAVEDGIGDGRVDRDEYLRRVAIGPCQQRSGVGDDDPTIIEENAA
jgi:hypothetical protein